MKTKMTIAIFMLMAFITQAQNATLVLPGQMGEAKVTPPKFEWIGLPKTANDVSLINRYLRKNVIIPENDAKYGSQGTEVVQFTVTSEGNVTDFKIINSVSGDIDKEIIRVLKSTTGMWNPGSNNDKLADMTIEVSMIFSMEQQEKQAVEKFTEWASYSLDKGRNALFNKHNLDKALKCFSDGIHYLPYNKGLLMLRGLCRYELGDREGAMEDWNRMSRSGGMIDMGEYANYLQSMKGYDVLMAVMKN